MVTVAVNEILVPRQIVPDGLWAMVTVGESAAGTEIEITLLVAVELVRQVSELVMVQLTVLPFVNVAEVNVLLFVPTGNPFTYH